MTHECVGAQRWEFLNLAQENRYINHQSKGPGDFNKMLHGLVHLDERGSDGSMVAMSLLGSEYVEVVSSVSRDTEYELKQTLRSNDMHNMVSASIGCSPSRSILCSHMSGSCSGRSCSCTIVCEHFLERNGDDDTLEIFLRKNEEFLRENLQYPFLFVITQGTEAMCVNANSAEDLVCQRLTNGCYTIR